ncbi:hypothetical protein GQS52_05895 [Streptomyces sp. SCUT-3]|uniref:peptidoglycan-binding protein n=1 Tax=Streptomyces TaxID=1883 RepID=UPI0015FD8F3B|nr:peptidoglycan-binding protein [Streptomyces sp. SCUT-3]QMV21383.1 hypothetical protein GQS52_05895 [Streptomyces sp. SCUT-3]
MEMPEFLETDPPSDCPCDDCARGRLADRWARTAPPAPVPVPWRPAVPTVAVTVLGTAVGTGAAHAAAAPEAAAPATARTGTASAPAAHTPMRLTRAQIIERASRWTDAAVPYSMSRTWSDGYRQDCSGFVSMAWGLGSNEWTGSLDEYAVRIAREDLRPGDMLLHHDPANPRDGSHVTLFGGWTDPSRSWYVAYEAARPHARKQATPYAYWDDSGKYLPYRYKHVVEEGAQERPPDTGSSSGADGPPDGDGPSYDGSPYDGGSSYGGAFPGAGRFGPGRHGDHVLLLGERLVHRGFAAHYRQGPSRTWSEADRRNVAAFQRAQGWSGPDADGFPGPETWRRLFP